ncbi:hypothetical protein CcCBS67573_g03821 [Chytriomyces confervae]|uniref:G-protein coupled receptors family 1 profile domain-containing protein n=1 Tax=Chytriomyces confervae TaxID=246404 RepID=A0A507FHX6_9FUNG|nr:hypothetical protein CcCBS67573_g03821 [Chytriomyces confervae]
MSCTDATELPLVCVIYGLAIQSGLNTLVTTVPQFFQSHASPKSPLFLGIVTCAFSLLIMADSSMYIPNHFADERLCSVLYMAEGVFYQGFLLIFDTFILVKTYIITRENKVFLAFMTTALLYRLAAAVADLILSGGVWDDESGACAYSQNGETMFHYAGADLACDVLATAGSLAMLISGKFGGVSDLIGQLSLENVIRSSLTLVLNSVLMYLGQLPTVSFKVLSIAWAIQNTVLLYLMNMEHVYS